MFRSSIFSFDTLHIGAFRPKAAALALAVLLVVEFAVARQEWIWTAVRGSDIGLFNIVEQELIPTVPPPEIVLLGSSRMRDAISPPDLERSLGLAEGAVLNLALTAGTPFDALTLYRRHRDRFSHARLLVISAEDWYTNGSIPVGDSDRRFASLSERFTDYRGEESLALIAGWFWRTYDARYAIERWLTCHFKWCEGSSSVGPDRRVMYRRQGPLEGPDSVDVWLDVRRFYQKYAWSRGRLRQMERLIATARADGKRVIVVQFPFRHEYLQAVRQRHAEAYAAYVRALRSLEGAEVLVYESANELGIAQRYFRDYGHLTPIGAELMADRLAAVIRGERPSRPGS